MHDEPPRRADKPVQIVVIGMHRSGTSATAGLLHACGAHIGDPGELKVPSKVNPRGFFERWDVRAVCDDFMQAAGAEWWKVSRFDPEAVAGASRRELSARAGAVVAALDRHPIWAIKDPRLCLALPIFREHLAEGAAGVLVLRHPLEVARSLQQRDGFPVAVGLALWEAHLTQALRNTAGMARVTVRYDDLVRDPAAAGRRLLADLAGAGVGGLAAPDFAEAIDASLRHHRADRQDEAAMSAAQRNLWRQLLAGELDDTALSDAARRTLEGFEASHEAEVGA